jgi:hypothetical protein
MESTPAPANNNWRQHRHSRETLNVGKKQQQTLRRARVADKAPSAIPVFAEM